MTERTHVLIIQGGREARTRVRKLLEREGDDRFHFSEADTAEQGLALYRSSGADCVLLARHLPDGDGLELLSALTADGQDVSIPIVMLTARSDDGVAIEAMRRGAQDYVVEETLETGSLERTILYAIERQRLQTELKQRALHQLELKNQFLSHVSHELRSPLTVVYQFVTLVLDGLAGPTNDEQQEYLRTAMRNVNQLQGMIDDLLEATRADTGKLSVSPERMTLGPALEQAVASLATTAAGKSVSLEVEPPSDLPPVCADPVRLAQILTNLIDNAIKFTPPGGQVRVRACRGPNEEMLCVQVSDSGCGITPSSHERIFDRLHQEETIVEASRKGLGLGLYICKELVSRHGGEIWAESERGRGSTISFTLPRYSLRRLVAPVVSVNGRIRERISLVSTHVFGVGAQSAERLGDTIEAEIESVVESCSLPDLDVLLPRLTQSNRMRSFFVVACTDSAGADVLAARLRGQLQRSNVLREAGIESMVTVRPVLGGSNPVEAPDIASVVAELERAVEEETRDVDRQLGERASAA